MKLSTTFRAAAFCTVAAAGLLSPAAFADNFSVVYGGPGVQTPNSTPYYEQFNGSLNGNGTYSTNFGGSPITGTYTNSGGNGFYLAPADLYGGAGGTGTYLTTDYLSSTTLTLSASVNYFGLWFSALDSGNVLTFYNGATEVYQFTAPDYVDAVGGCPASPYCGNPTSNFHGQDPDEQFAYINLTDLNGTFNTIVFSQVVGEHYGRFEADNNAVALVNATPEPSSLALLGTGIAAMAGAVRRRLRK